VPEEDSWELMLLFSTVAVFSAVAAAAAALAL